MNKIGMNAEVDLGKMTIDEIMKELTSLISEDREAKETFLWQLYKALSPGTCFRALHPIEEIAKEWFLLDLFEEHIALDTNEKYVEIIENGIFNSRTKMQLRPFINENESVMFLGMSEKEYDYQKIVQRFPTMNGRRVPHNVVVDNKRSCPRWLIGEKIITWPLDLTNFSFLVSGTGARVIDKK